MLVLSRKPKEAVIINGNVKVTIAGVQGQQVRLAFEAPKAIEIYREEIFEKIQQEKTNRNPSENHVGS